MRPVGPIIFFFCLLTPLYINCAYGTSERLHDNDTEITIAFTGEENGYLEPCGCEQRRTGGIAKRQSLLAVLRQAGKTVLPLSLGDLAGHRKRQDEIKIETLAQALADMQYTVHNLGEKDLQMGLKVISYTFFPDRVKLLSSNVALTDSLGIEVQPYVIEEFLIDDRKVRVGILGILSPELIETAPHGVEVTPPSEAVGRLIEELKDVDLLVLMAHAGFEEAVRLAGEFPEFQLVISGHNEDEPVIEQIGDTVVAACGSKGKYVGLFHYRPGDEETDLEMVELDERYEDSSQMAGLLKGYQQRLRDEDLLGRVEKFSYDDGAAYAGNAVCGACHPATFEHWKTTPHASAHETLVKAEHDYDPECVACHVTGLYYRGGFTSVEKTPELKDVGCEECHGPGSQHVEAARNGLKTKDYGKTGPRGCETCHDVDHSSQFQYENYWLRMAHPKEQPKN